MSWYNHWSTSIFVITHSFGLPNSSVTVNMMIPQSQSSWELGVDWVITSMAKGHQMSQSEEELRTKSRAFWLLGHCPSHGSRNSLPRTQIILPWSSGVLSTITQVTSLWLPSKCQQMMLTLIERGKGRRTRKKCCSFGNETSQRMWTGTTVTTGT